MTRVIITYISDTVITHCEAIIEYVAARDKGVLETADFDVGIRGIGFTEKMN